MNSFIHTAIIAISASFLGLTFSTQVRSQVRLDMKEPIALEFQSFFKMPLGPKGLEVTDKLVQADGQFVRLKGFMVKSENPAQGSFVLAPRPIQLSEHADGDANDLPASVCWIYLDNSQKSWVVPHIPGPITVEGIFNFKRMEAPDGSIAWFHLQLKPDAISEVQPEQASNQHQLQHSHSH
jgi:hypothetical protein